MVLIATSPVWLCPSMLHVPIAEYKRVYVRSGLKNEKGHKYLYVPRLMKKSFSLQHPEEGNKADEGFGTQALWRMAKGAGDV